MKKICFFSGDITRGGGAEKAAITIANGLCRIGNYEISFLSLVEQRQEPFFPILPEIQRFVLKKDGKWVQPGPGYLPFVPALRRFLKKQEIDMVIDIDIVLDVLSLPAAAGLAVKVISWEHLNCVYEQSVPYRRIISRLTAAFSPQIVTLTERDKGNYERLLHRRERIAVIENPVDVPEPGGIPKEPLILTVGRLTQEKGVDLLAQVLPGILEKYPDWKWCFLGEGECRELLEAVRKEHQLEDRLLLPGTVQETGRYYERAAILVLASRSEALPMSLLEARAHGVPCIAFDVPVGPAELIQHGVNGFLVPPFDLEKLAEQTAKLVTDPELRARFSAAAKAGMEKYSLKTVLGKWVQLLET